jgi:hypothetical protein
MVGDCGLHVKHWPHVTVIFSVMIPGMFDTWGVHDNEHGNEDGTGIMLGAVLLEVRCYMGFYVLHFRGLQSADLVPL